MPDNWMQKIWAILMLSLSMTTAMTTAMALPLANESFDFHAYYQGVFSADKQIGIADVRWTTQFVNLAETGASALETRMDVSSAAYSFVEKLYPFRIQYRSLTSIDPVRTVAYERYDSTDDHGRELTWLDLDSEHALRFREGYTNDGNNDKQLPSDLLRWGSQQQDYQFYKFARERRRPGMLDEIALLQRIRNEELAVGGQLEVAVTDGKKQYIYKVFVVEEEQLSLENKTWNALKIRLDAYRIKRGTPKQEYDSIWLWVSKSSPHIPLRFQHEVAIGQFVIDLRNGVPE